MSMMNYEETINFLYSQLPMFTRIGAAAYKKDLHNTIALCAAFGNPQEKFKSIHIAGTNGKGSTSHMLAAIFQQGGYKTGLYTSPHLKDFRERIKIDGEMIPEDVVIDFTERSKALIADLQPSFFELTVAMAFDYFAASHVDIVIVETGLGGRLDSTNIIRPALSIITNIGWDHMNILGNTLEAIAAEKAGIIKQKIPVVIGETLSQTKPVFLDKAAAEDAPIHFASDIWQVSAVTHGFELMTADYSNTKSGTNTIIASDLPGIYQQKNIATVLTAVDVLNTIGYHFSNDVVQQALKQVKNLTGLHGRWQLIHKNPWVILDVGHNEDGVKQIFANIDEVKTPTMRVSIITGMVSDKEVDKVLRLFPADYEYFFTNAHMPRALPAAHLQEKAAAVGLSGTAFDDVNDALKAAMEMAAPEDLIVVCGSVFVVGEVNEF